VLRATLIGLIKLYRVAVSPWMPPVCRFTPSCSTYALEAVQLHGGRRGGWLMLKRLARCQPWGGSGYDPVPPVEPRGWSGEIGRTGDVGGGSAE
jgi:putative membrane protein insertion efficiency factor